MTNKLQWRLSKLPTPDELRELVKDKIITQEEARQILFTDKNEENHQDSDATINDLREEIKFLKNIISKMEYKEIIKIVEKYQQPYKYYPWYKPYDSWYCDSNAILCSSGSVNAVQSFDTIS